MKRGPCTPKKPAPANQRRAPPSLRPPLAAPATPGPPDSRTDPQACPPPPAGPLPAPSWRPLLPVPPAGTLTPTGRLLRPLLRTLLDPPNPKTLFPVTNQLETPSPAAWVPHPLGVWVSSPQDPRSSTLSDPTSFTTERGQLESQLPTQAVPSPDSGYG